MKMWPDVVLINIGLWIPPLLWAASLQFGQILPYLDCTTQSRNSAATAFSAMALTLLAGALSWRSAARLGEDRFVFRSLAVIATMSAAVFAYAIALQAGATLVLSGCER